MHEGCILFTNTYWSVKDVSLRWASADNVLCQTPWLRVPLTAYHCLLLLCGFWVCVCVLCGGRERVAVRGRTNICISGGIILWYIKEYIFVSNILFLPTFLYFLFLRTWNLSKKALCNRPSFGSWCFRENISICMISNFFECSVFSLAPFWLLLLS